VTHPVGVLFFIFHNTAMMSASSSTVFSTENILWHTQRNHINTQLIIYGPTGSTRLDLLDCCMTLVQTMHSTAPTEEKYSFPFSLGARKAIAIQQPPMRHNVDVLFQLKKRITDSVSDYGYCIGV